MLAFDKCSREMCSEDCHLENRVSKESVDRLRPRNEMELIEIRSVCALMRAPYKAIRPTEELNQLIYLICLRSFCPLQSVSAAQKGTSK